MENLAELARIDLNIEEKEAILKDMDGILNYVKQIESVDIPEITLHYQLLNVWREDEVIERDFSKEEIINQFPASQDNFLKVKKVL